MTSEWVIDRQKRTATRAGVVVQFHPGGRGGRAWLYECLTPGVLDAYLGEGDGRPERASAFLAEAAEVWRRVDAAGHTRKHCPHRHDPHSWTKCPANTDGELRERQVPPAGSSHGT